MSVKSPLYNHYRESHRTASTDDGVRLDVAAKDFKGYPSQRVYIDIRLFNPLSQPYQGHSLQVCYKRNEEDKKRKCD